MAEPDQIIAGTLQSGFLAIGGEDTGFRLHNVTLEVDVADVANGPDLEGVRVSAVQG